MKWDLTNAEALALWSPSKQILADRTVQQALRRTQSWDLKLYAVAKQLARAQRAGVDHECVQSAATQHPSITAPNKVLLRRRANDVQLDSLRKLKRKAALSVTAWIMHQLNVTAHDPIPLLALSEDGDYPCMQTLRRLNLATYQGAHKSFGEQVDLDMFQSRHKQLQLSPETTQMVDEMMDRSFLDQLYNISLNKGFGGRESKQTVQRMQKWRHAQMLQDLYKTRPRN